MKFERLRAWKDAPTNERTEHLSGTEPILTTVENNAQNSSATLDWLKSLEQRPLMKLDFYDRQKKNAESGILSNGTHSYVISPVTENPIYSPEYRNCQGIILAATDRDGKAQAIMTHHNPEIFPEKESYAQFKADMRGRIRELMSQTLDGTLDVVMFGGDAFQHEESESVIDKSMDRGDDYQIVAELVAELIESETGIKPRIVEGPRIKWSPNGQQIAIYDTPNRHLHILVREAAPNSGKNLEVEDIRQELDDLKVLQHKLENGS